MCLSLGANPRSNAAFPHPHSTQSLSPREVIHKPFGIEPAIFRGAPRARIDLWAGKGEPSLAYPKRFEWLLSADGTREMQPEFLRNGATWPADPDPVCVRQRMRSDDFLS